MNIRAGLPEDVSAVLTLEGDAFGVDAWSRALVEDAVPALLVADVDGVLAAYAVVTVAGDVTDLQRIAVRPAERRRGLARGLVLAAADAALAEDAERLLVEVRADNEPALAFYSALGFAAIDRRPRYYRDGADAVVLQRTLGAGAGRLDR